MGWLGRGAVGLCVAAVLCATTPGIALAQSFSFQLNAGSKVPAPGGILPTITGTITDAVAPTVTVTFGDGTSATTVPVPVPGQGGSFTVPIDHQYQANGNFTLKVTATDQGVSQSVQTTVQVFGITSGGGGGNGGGGTGFVQPLIASLTATPSQPVAGQNVTFTASVSNLPTPDWNWLWQFGFGGQTAADTSSGSALKTTTTFFSTPGTYLVQFGATTTPPSGGFDPTSSLTVQVFGRVEAVVVDCGTPISGLPTTLTATVTDLSDPTTAASALAGRLIQFFVNGNPVGSPQPVTVTSSNTAVATLQTTVTALPGQTLTCTGGVANNALVSLRDSSNAVIGLTALVLPPGSPSLLPITAVLDRLGGVTIPGGITFPAFGLAVPRPVEVLTPIGKVTGHARLADGTEASFEVESKDGRTLKGNLEYKSPTVDFKATSFQLLGFSPDGRIAIFAGTGLTSGKNPRVVHFLVHVTDNDTPKNSDKRSDTFFIAFTGGATGADGGTLDHGNVEIHAGSGKNRADGGRIG